MEHGLYHDIKLGPSVVKGTTSNKWLNGRNARVYEVHDGPFKNDALFHRLVIACFILETCVVGDLGGGDGGG